MHNFALKFEFRNAKRKIQFSKKNQMLKLRDKNLLLGVKATTPKNNDVVVSMEKPQYYIDTKLNNKCDSDRTTFIMRTPQIVEYARVCMTTQAMP